jgi:hypothetical protein
MKSVLLACLAVLVIACGGNKGSNNGDAGGGDGDGGANGDGGGDGDGGTGDGGVSTGDARYQSNCTTPTPGNPQCSNCIDDDNDGDVDGYDIHCAGPLDNDEATFRTGLPGDNSDPKHQDCFFDGDSGAGNDKCDIHTCCILGVTDPTQCPYPGAYNPNACPPPVGTTPLDPQCIGVCGAGTPPGCDCFGCCTICDDNNNCYDIALGLSPNCNETNLSDPTVCIPCTKVASCNNPCGGDTCILCPGQDPDDVPPECNMTECPANQQSCTSMPCPDGSYCTNGCCVGIIQ